MQTLFSIARVVIAVGVSALFFGCSTGRVLKDTITESTVADNDATAMVQGCGNAPAVGIAYCRFVEGDSTEDLIYFIAPAADCKRDTCVFIKVWDSQGNLVFGTPIKKGETKIGVPWSVLLSQKDNVKNPVSGGVSDAPALIIPHVFDRSQRGFWSWNVQMYWLDPKGFEHQTQAQGEIVLRVYKKGYQPLHTVSSDPNFVFQWQEAFNNQLFEFKATSSLRSYIGVKN